MTEYELLNQIRPDWEARRIFLFEKCPQPSFVSEEAAAVEIEAHLKACALSAGVPETSLIIKPTEMITTANYNQVALNVNASGSAMSIMKLVFLIQAANHSNVKDGTLKHNFMQFQIFSLKWIERIQQFLNAYTVRWYSEAVIGSSASPNNNKEADSYATIDKKFN